MSETNEERRYKCLLHENTLKDLKNAVFGNGRPGIKDRVIKMEVMIYIVIALLVTNGALLGWTIKSVSKLSTTASQIEKIKEDLQNEIKKHR